MNRGVDAAHVQDLLVPGGDGRLEDAKEAERHDRGQGKGANVRDPVDRRREEGCK